MFEEIHHVDTIIIERPVRHRTVRVEHSRPVVDFDDEIIIDASDISLDWETSEEKRLRLAAAAAELRLKREAAAEAARLASLRTTTKHVLVRHTTGCKITFAGLAGKTGRSWKSFDWTKRTTETIKFSAVDDGEICMTGSVTGKNCFKLENGRL